MANNIDEVSVPKLIGFGVGALLLLSVLFGSWFTVDQGERVVVKTNGAITSVKEPGIYFKAPFVQSIDRFSVRTEKSTFTGVETYSKDIQTATVTVTVNHRLDPAKVASVYTNFGTDYEAKIVQNTVLNTIKVVFGQYSATESIDHRAALVKDMNDTLAAKLQPEGILIDNVSVENIAFSGEYEKAVEARMKAEVEVQQANQTLQKEKINADIARTTAQGTADAAVMAAKGQAQAIQLQGEAEAKAINAKAEALRQNNDLVAYTLAKQWDGKLPTTMLPGQGLPMIKLPTTGDQK